MPKFIFDRPFSSLTKTGKAIASLSILSAVGLSFYVAVILRTKTIEMYGIGKRGRGEAFFVSLIVAIATFFVVFLIGWGIAKLLGIEVKGRKTGNKQL